MTAVTALPRRAALIGCGVIGAGWAARFLLSGIDVTLHDPDPGAPRRLERLLERAERAWRRLTSAPVRPYGSFRFATSIEETVADAEWVQESVPEREDLKRTTLATIDAAAPAGAILASSTSGLRPSRLQEGLARPGRFLVAHPFNPVYLLPLVELCGGRRTDPATLERAEGVLSALGMHPLRLDHEIDGFLADRLMEALWREALHLVNDDVATAEQIDRAIVYGPGLRWAIKGTFQVFRLGGGEAGMRHFMAQFGPTLELPWSKLRAPELTPHLIEKIVAQSDAQAGGRSVRELEELRDDCLVSVLLALKQHGHGAGAELAAFEERLHALSHRRSPREEDDLDRPLRLHETRVQPEWVDDNGRMIESRYLQVFGDATEALLRYVGVDRAHLDAGYGYDTVETHIVHLHEVTAGEPLHLTTRLLAADAERMHLFHEMFRSRDELRLATAEQMLLHVDTRAGRARPAREDIAARLRRIGEAHTRLPPPDLAGRRVGEPLARRSA